MIGREIEVAKHHLLEGNIVGIPTETVYGLAGNAYHLQAIQDIYRIKQRPLGDPLIVHTHSLEQLSSLVIDFPEAAQRLAQHFWPGPLTLLLPKRETIPNLVTAGKPTVAIRIPRHPMTQELLQQLPFPLVAPSANPFGYISPTTAQHVADQLGDHIPYILDGGPCDHGLESTIIGFDHNKPTVYRLGSIALEDIMHIVGPIHYQKKAYTPQAKAQAPGTFAYHYAPHTPLYIGDLHQLHNLHKAKKVGALLFTPPMLDFSPEHQCILSPEASLAEAAQNLFAALRYLDQCNLDLIIAPIFPEVGLGKAINDRLRRASQRFAR